MSLTAYTRRAGHDAETADWWMDDVMLQLNRGGLQWTVATLILSCQLSLDKGRICLHCKGAVGMSDSRYGGAVSFLTKTPQLTRSTLWLGVHLSVPRRLASFVSLNQVNEVTAGNCAQLYS